MDWLEEFWENMLSEEPRRIIAAWSQLDDNEKNSIYVHLTGMTTGDGWLDVQRQSAQIALNTIDQEKANK
jgi:hypothetical protein